LKPVAISGGSKASDDDLLHKVDVCMKAGATGLTIERADEVAVVPLGIPLLAGPGAITTVMIYMTHPVADPADKLFIFAGILVSTLAAFVLLRNADRIFRRLGRTGTRAVGRVMGLLLAAVAVQFIIDGVFDVARMKGLVA